MSNTDKLREIVEKTFPLFGSRLDEWRKVERDRLLSDLTALIPITVEDFEAAIKNTDG